MSRRAFDGRVLAGLLVLNLVAHFIPFERPGFQTDDFMWLHHSRVEPEWSFVDLSLSQATRPLGWLLYILMPKLAGLHEVTQLAILVGMTSLLTGLVYVSLLGLLSRPLANLAAVFFVVWPVKHEIYSSQVVGVGVLAAVLIVVSGLCYRRWTQTSGKLSLLLAVLSYGLSIFIYELGYLAPLVFYWSERSRKPRDRGAALFLIPALSYWIWRVSHGDPAQPIGSHPLSLMVLVFNLVTSLPSSLFGFQLARNIGYGLWGLMNAPLWLFCLAALTGVTLFVLSSRSIREEQQREPATALLLSRALGAVVCAALLALPAAMVLVESRHTILASAGMSVALAVIAARFRPAVGATILTVLLLASQGLAFRQAQAAQLQARVREVITQRRDEIRTARAVVFDLDSLADRVPYTWGDRPSNVLRGYWGIFAFSSGGFTYMVDDTLALDRRMKRPKVGTCAFGLVVSETAVRCERNHMGGKPFALSREGTLVIDFKTMPLPPSIRVPPTS